MTERTANQIKAMKQQTIGVEIEMNSITRQKAAKTAAEFFGTGRYQDTAGRNDTAHGAPGMQTAGSGNSRRMFPLQDLTMKNANW